MPGKAGLAARIAALVFRAAYLLVYYEVYRRRVLARGRSRFRRAVRSAGMPDTLVQRLARDYERIAGDKIPGLSRLLSSLKE